MLFSRLVVRFVEQCVRSRCRCTRASFADIAISAKHRVCAACDRVGPRARRRRRRCRLVTPKPRSYCQFCFRSCANVCFFFLFRSESDAKPPPPGRCIVVCVCSSQGDPQLSSSLLRLTPPSSPFCFSPISAGCALDLSSLPSIEDNDRSHLCPRQIFSFLCCIVRVVLCAAREQLSNCHECLPLFASKQREMRSGVVVRRTEAQRLLPLARGSFSRTRNTFVLLLRCVF